MFLVSIWFCYDSINTGGSSTLRASGVPFVQYMLPQVGRDRNKGRDGFTVTVLNHFGENLTISGICFEALFDINLILL